MNPPRRGGGRLRRTAGRRGTSMVEALVALLLGLLMVALAVQVVARQRRAVAELARISDALATVRIARELLGREGRDGDPARDGWSVSHDSLALRAFRGVAFVCGPGPTPRDVVVQVGGVRAPEPAKDSILVLDAGGRWSARALTDATAAPPCSEGGGGLAETWRLSEPPPAGAVLARYFERGSYHVVAGALRYRRGLSGRQPLTPGLVRTPFSGFQASPAAVSLVLDLDEGPGSIPWRVVIATGAAGAPVPGG